MTKTPKGKPESVRGREDRARATLELSDVPLPGWRRIKTPTGHVMMREERVTRPDWSAVLFASQLEQARQQQARIASAKAGRRRGQEGGAQTKRLKRDLDDAKIAERIERLLVDNDTEAPTSRRKLVEALGTVDHREVKRICDARGWLMPRRRP